MKAPFTLDQARSQILAKIEKAGPKGVASLYTASAPAEKRALFEEASAALETSQSLYIDRRKPKPKYYAWAHRPQLPSVESVATRLEQIAAQDFPNVLTRARAKAALKSQKEEAALLEPALAHAVLAGTLLRLGYRKAKAVEDLFLAASSLAAPAPSSGAEPPVAEIRAAYERLVQQTGFPAVPIAALHHESGAPLEQLQPWLLAEHQAGRAILSRGDWSLADETRRRAAINWQCEMYLSVRLLPPA